MTGRRVVLKAKCSNGEVNLSSGSRYGSSQNCDPMPTHLAQGFGNARVRSDMRAAIQGGTDPAPSVWLRSVLAISQKGNKSECVFRDGTCILISSFLASFIRPGDELRVPTDISAADAATEIHARCIDPKDRRRDVFLAEIGYVGQPRKDMRDTLFGIS